MSVRLLHPRVIACDLIVVGIDRRDVRPAIPPYANPAAQSRTDSVTCNKGEGVVDSRRAAQSGNVDQAAAMIGSWHRMIWKRS
jgi:hypothetical protein